MEANMPKKKKRKKKVKFIGFVTFDDFVLMWLLTARILLHGNAFRDAGLPVLDSYSIITPDAEYLAKDQSLVIKCKTNTIPADAHFYQQSLLGDAQALKVGNPKK
jgi:hypothetical protein